MERDWPYRREAGALADQQTAARVLKVLDDMWSVVDRDLPLPDGLSSMVGLMPAALDKVETVAFEIVYNGKSYRTEGFRAGGLCLIETFSTRDGDTGQVRLYCDHEFQSPKATLTTGVKSLVYHTARILAAYINGRLMREQAVESGERLKELSTINQTTRILSHGHSVADVLQKIVHLLPSGWQYPEIAQARITYDGRTTETAGFRPTRWIQTQRFETLDNKMGSIDICYTPGDRIFKADPFLSQERDLLVNLVRLIADFLNARIARRNQSEYQERQKELKVINETRRIIALEGTMEDTFQQIVERIPHSMLHGDVAMARIRVGARQFMSSDYHDSPWAIVEHFSTANGIDGLLWVGYPKDWGKGGSDAFLKEEYDLVKNLSHLLVGYLNGREARGLNVEADMEAQSHDQEEVRQGKASKHLLQNFMYKTNAARDIYHDLMPFRVSEILLVATLYDAFAIENEGRFTEQIMGGFYHLHLSSLPRITGVSTYDEAMAKLREKHYDLIIVMLGTEKDAGLLISKMVKMEYPYIPIFMLLNTSRELPFYDDHKKELGAMDEIFVWHGDPKIFSSMVYHLEDKVNVENDTEIGLARVILLVEDSVRYYSRYLPLLYTSVLEQTHRLIDDIQGDELYGVLRLKARPKVLLARNYEEALEVLMKYRDYLLCLISDVEFRRQGRMEPNAGFDLVNYAKQQIKDLPVILQSSRIEYSRNADELKTVFINKNSDSLMQEIKTFISQYLGFGNFAYKDKAGKVIAIAGNLKEFEQQLKHIPIESVLYHARKNHFSLWLMARGEMKLAQMIAPYRISDFVDEESVRAYLLEVLQKDREEKNQGKIVDFDEVVIPDGRHVYRLSSGSLGGKGRGIAFINTLLYHFDFGAYVQGIRVMSPRTAVIGTAEFERFMAQPGLQHTNLQGLGSHQVKSLFLKGKLSQGLVSRLDRLVGLFTSPIAVRSSGLLEDSQKQPFAGVFETYILPNSHNDKKERLRQLCDAVKLVYASVFSEEARAFTEAVDFKVEDEKMAVVIQEAVGHQYGSVYYPHISGVAQSYNFYSYGYMAPEDGFAVLALGLGKYVVDGEKAWRFCPVYPQLENSSAKDQLKNTQTEFYAVDLARQQPDLMVGDTAGLVRLETMEAEAHGVLKHLVSVYNVDDATIQPGLNLDGPRILNFADILRYDYVPLARSIELVLDVVREAMGSAVEIEFALDLNKDEDGAAALYLLQIKPLLSGDVNYSIDMSDVDEDQIILLSSHSMGNGQIQAINEVIYIENSRFDSSKTYEMAAEIERLNQKMKAENRYYILIGPGRWGTRDPWIGIPVSWGQISNARMIVETDLEGFALEASGGSHFFHNVTSMKIGYCSVLHGQGEGFVRWDILEGQELIEETAFCRHIRFKQNLNIRMDGKRRKTLITYGKDRQNH